MKIQRLIQGFEQREYERILVNNTEYVSVYYKITEMTRADGSRMEDKQAAKVVIIWDLEKMGELGQETYNTMIDRVKWKFLNWGYADAEVLNLLCTWEPETARDFCTDYNDHWILCMGTGELIIYENQVSRFMDVDAIIEEAGKPINIKRLPLCTIAIVAANFLVFLIVELTGGSNTEHMLRCGAMFWPYVFEKKEVFRLVSYMFLHFGIEHFINNMFVFFFIGGILEKYLGRIRYSVLYFGSGVLAGVASMVYNKMENNPVVSAGASGAIFGVVGAMVFIILINKGKVKDLSPRAMILFVLLSFYSGFTGQQIDNMAHIGGFISGFFLSALLYKRQVKKEAEELGKAE